MVNKTRKLLLIDSATMRVDGYEGKKLLESAMIEVDGDTTPEGVRDTLEEFRKGLSAKATERQKKLNQRHAYATAEMSSWFPPVPA